MNSILRILGFTAIGFLGLLAAIFFAAARASHFASAVGDALFAGVFASFVLAFLWATRTAWVVWLRKPRLRFGGRFSWSLLLRVLLFRVAVSCAWAYAAWASTSLFSRDNPLLFGLWVGLLMATYLHVVRTVQWLASALPPYREFPAGPMLWRPRLSKLRSSSTASSGPQAAAFEEDEDPFPLKMGIDSFDEPSFNIDGTPMAGIIDANGNAYGFTSDS